LNESLVRGLDASTSGTGLPAIFVHPNPNTMSRPLIAVFRGGYSGEAVISQQSAKRMAEAIDPARYEALYVSISVSEWTCESLEGTLLKMDRGNLSVDRGNGAERFSAALIAIHGAPGEDGRLQGFLDILGIPYQTGDVLNMSTTFSKFTTIASLRTMGFTVAPSVVLFRTTPDLLNKAATVGLPCFVKPDQSGSSLGVSKVKTAEEMAPALAAAFAECRSVLVEGAVSGRELTCGVLRVNGVTTAMPVCEIRTSREFFDYEAKYHAQDTEELIPAPLPDDVTAMVQDRSIAIYDAMNCKGMVRVDHFWTGSELITIELNTVPGFSGASIFPKMLQVSGYGVERAVNGLIEDMLAAKH
jgi:D-alanine-D-alanine ligase